MKIGTFATKADFRRAKTIEWLEKQGRTVFTKQEVLAGFYWALRQERKILLPYIPTSDPIDGYISPTVISMAFYGYGRAFTAYLKDPKGPKYLAKIGRDKYVIYTTVSADIKQTVSNPTIESPIANSKICYTNIITMLDNINDAIDNIDNEDIESQLMAYVPTIIANIIHNTIDTNYKDGDKYPAELIAAAVDKLKIYINVEVDR